MVRLMISVPVQGVLELKSEAAEYSIAVVTPVILPSLLLPFVQATGVTLGAAGPSAFSMVAVAALEMLPLCTALVTVTVMVLPISAATIV